LPNIDFVGNYHNSHFDITNPNYLGEWDKPTLYNNLTEYGNLVLLSDGEADPLVVKEALIAGLGVVISECASANLNLLKGFITIIPNEKINDLEFVNKAIIENRKYSVENREEIRDYALSKFSWKKVIDNYYERCLKNYKLF
jgi:glycosyltransferase involved in cell wall biosynthesis